MVPILFRAFSTVVTVLIAVAVAARAGDTAAGKVWAAVLVALVIALVEGLLLWAPKHSKLAQRLLDPRARMVGTYVQDVKKVHTGGGPAPDNRFAVFHVDATGGGEYAVTGFAYDSAGNRYADFRSEGTPEFAADGRSMTYLWDGEALDESSAGAPDRKGVARIDLRRGTGRVDNVGMHLMVLFDVHPVDRAWLAALGLDDVQPQSLRRAEVRDAFAKQYAARLAASGHRPSVSA